MGLKRTDEFRKDAVRMKHDLGIRIENVHSVQGAAQRLHRPYGLRPADTVHTTTRRLCASTA